MLLREREWLTRLARRLLGDGPDADDLVQETLTRALQADTVPARPRGWLSTVARNLRLEDRRAEARRHAREELVARPESSTDGDALERAALRQKLLQHVLELPEPERTAIVLRYLEDLPYEEVAAKQNATVIAVRKRVSRAIERLKAQLDDSQGGRSHWAGLLALASEIQPPAGMSAEPAAPSLTLTAGVLAMSTQLKLILGGGILATLLVVIATQFDLLQPGTGPRPARPTEFPSAQLAAADEAQNAGDDLHLVESLPIDDSATRAAVEGPASSDVGDSVLTGLVLDHLGQPLPSALVEVRTHEKTDYSVLDIAYGRASLVVGQTTTDHTGRFELDVASHRPLDLVVREERHALAAQRVYGGEDILVRMALGAVIEGRITRASDGQPLEGIWVRGWMRSQSPIVHRLDGHSDRTGTYRFEGLPAGRVTLALQPEDWMQPSWADIELEPGLLVRRDYALEDGITVSGRVTDAITGEPIVGAEVGPGWTLRTGVRTDDDGRYALRGFGSPGVTDIHVRAAGYGRSSHDFGYDRLPQEDVERNFALRTARAAKGRIVGPEGAPRSGVYVGGIGIDGNSGEWEGTRTRADGRFELESLVPGGRHQLFVQAQRFGTLIIDFPADEISRPVIDFGDVRLPRAARVSGRVIDESGNPRPGVKVLLRGRHQGAGRFYPGDKAGLEHHLTRARVADSDTRGRFHFTDLAPGTYTVLASVQQGLQDGEVEVSVTEGQALGQLALILPKGLSIQGQVVSSSGVPCQGLSISVQPKKGGSQRANVKTDSRGRFEVIGLTEESYVVQARPWMYNAEHPEASLFEQSVTVPGGTDGLLIELPRAVEIVGVVQNAAGEPVTNVVVLAQEGSSGRRLSQARTDDQGHFTLRVPEGVLVDLETREARGRTRSTSYHQRDDRSVTRIGVESAGGEVLLIVEGY